MISGQIFKAVRSSALRKSALVSVAAGAGLLMLSGSTQDAIANGDTRTITLFHQHTKEQLTVTFRRWGQYDSNALGQLNRFLRDWRNDQQVRMDPRLFDVIWTVMRQTGASGPVSVLSAYRSPGTNAMLRRRSRGVAKASQHIQGRAMDIRFHDISMHRARDVAVQLQLGGVGFYPSSHTPFMHVDVGSVRSWPRLTRGHLARLFPDGKTVHLPAGGGTMQGYEVARAEILARGGSVMGYATGGGGDEGYSGPRRSLWATLFGGGADQDEDEAEIAAGPRRKVAGRGRRTVALAPAPAAPVGGGDDTGVLAFATGAPTAPAAPVATLRRGAAPPTRVAVAAAPAVAPEPAAPATAPPPPKPEVKPIVTALPNTRTLLPSAAPIPASRPKGLVPVDDDDNETDSKGGKLVAMPLPPSRPADAPGAVVAAAPADEKPAPRTAAVEEPVATRPVALAFASPAALPPARPAALPAAVTRGISAPLRDKPSIRTELKKLLVTDKATPAKVEPAAAPVKTVRTRLDEPKTPSGFAAAPAKTARTSFSSGVDSDLATGSFTGPAVKALPKLSFAR